MHEIMGIQGLISYADHSTFLALCVLIQRYQISSDEEYRDKHSKIPRFVRYLPLLVASFPETEPHYTFIQPSTFSGNVDTFVSNDLFQNVPPESRPDKKSAA